MQQQLRFSLFLVPLALAVGCDGCHNTGTRPVVVMPRGAGPSLSGASPLPLGVIDLVLLNQITSQMPIRFGMEFELGPKLTMVRVPGPLVSDADAFIAQVANDIIPPLEVDNVICGTDNNGDPLMPDAGGMFEQPILVAGASGYPWGDLVVQRMNADLTELRFIPPDQTAFPAPPPNSIEVHVQLKNVGATIADSSGATTLSAAQVDLFCLATALPVAVNGRGCGEVPVRCTRATAGIQGLGGAYHEVLLDLFGDYLQDELVARMLLGFNMHFDTFSSSALTIDTTGGLSLAGTPSMSCSHNPPPPPEPAPFRALSRVRTQAGEGYLVGSQGSVWPFSLSPEVSMDWMTPQSVEEFLPWTRPAGLEIFADELSRDLSQTQSLDIPDALHANVELLRFLDKCPTKPMPFKSVIETLELANEYAQFGDGHPFATPERREDGKSAYGYGGGSDYGNDGYGKEGYGAGGGAEGGNFDDGRLPPTMFFSVDGMGDGALLTRDIRELSFLDQVLVTGVTDVDVREVMPLLEQLDGRLCPGPACPDECREDCGTWTRFDVLEDLLPPFGDFEIPVIFEIYVKDIDRVFTEEIKPPCPLVPVGDDGAEVWDKFPPVITTMPTVTFAGMQVDSATFDADTVQRISADGSVHNVGLDANSVSEKGAVHQSVSDPQGASSVRVTLLDDCKAHKKGEAHLATPCWSGTFMFPPPGSVQLTSAFSGITTPRTALKDVLDGTVSVATIGARTSSVQGTLDRSGLYVFTAVPPIYQAIGLTNDSWDYREINEDERWQTASYFDWEHSNSTFPTPVLNPGVKHPNIDHVRFLASARPAFTYFADWSTDTLMTRWVGDEPFSSCPLRSQLFASPRTLDVSGAGRGASIATIDARSIFTTTRRLGANGQIEVAPSVPAIGPLAPATP